MVLNTEIFSMRNNYIFPSRFSNRVVQRAPHILSSTALAAACFAFFFDWPDPIAEQKNECDIWIYIFDCTGHTNNLSYWDPVLECWFMDCSLNLDEIIFGIDSLLNIQFLKQRNRSFRRRALQKQKQTSGWLLIRKDITNNTRKKKFLDIFKFTESISAVSAALSASSNKLSSSRLSIFMLETWVYF